MGQAINTNATSEETTSKQSNEDKAPLLLTNLPAFWQQHTKLLSSSCTTLYHFRLLRNSSGIPVKWPNFILLKYFCPNACLLPSWWTGLNTAEAKFVSFTSRSWAWRAVFSLPHILSIQPSRIKCTAPYLQMISVIFHSYYQISFHLISVLGR